MSKTIVIRNVPDGLHDRLKARAAERGTSLSDFLLAEVSEIADRPTLAELMERLGAEEAVDVDEPPEATIRRLRQTGWSFPTRGRPSRCGSAPRAAANCTPLTVSA